MAVWQETEIEQERQKHFPQLQNIFLKDQLISSMIWSRIS